MCKYSSKNNTNQWNMRCAENVAGKKETSETQNTPCKLTQLCASFFNDVDSVVLMLYIVALVQPHSLWCFFSCWVVTNNIRTEPYPRLEKHADDGHHRKSSVSDFGIELFGFLSRVRRCQHLESKVSSIRSTSWGLFLGDLAESHVGQDLTPSCRVGILGL